MNILYNFVSPRALDPDPVRMNPDLDPDWFSGSRTSMERLTQKIKKYKKEDLQITSKIHSMVF